MPGSRSRRFLVTMLLAMCPVVAPGAEPVCPTRQTDPQARLWEAILWLTTPGGSEQAQSTLRQAGREGFSLLLQVVRLTGAQLESPKPWPVPPRTGAGSVPVFCIFRASSSLWGPITSQKVSVQSSGETLT